MTKFALSFAALATAGLLAVGPLSSAQADNIRVAQATVVKKKVVVKPAPVVRKRTVVRTTGRHCRTVTVRKRVGNRTVVSKTRRCS